MIIFPASCCRVQYYAASGFLTITYTLMHANYYYFHLTLPKPKRNLCVILRTLILWLCWIRLREESGAYVLYATCDVLLSITFLDYYLTLALKTTNSHQDLKTSYDFSQIYQTYAKKLYFLDLGKMCFMWHYKSNSCPGFAYGSILTPHSVTHEKEANIKHKLWC